MRKLIAALVAVSLLLAGVSPAYARCDPGRAPLAQTTYFGGEQTANAGVYFRELSAYIDNDDIPYIEGGGHTWSWMQLKTSATSGAYFMVGLEYSMGQGRLDNTVVRIKYTNEEGTALYVDTQQAYVLSNIGGSDTQIKITLRWSNVDPWNKIERIEVFVNGGLTPIYDNSFQHGAEAFTQARIYVHKENRGSQVIGENAARHKVLGALYITQYGVGNWTPNGLIRSDAAQGNVVYGSTYVHTWDTAC